MHLGKCREIPRLTGHIDSQTHFFFQLNPHYVTIATSMISLRNFHSAPARTKSCRGRIKRKMLWNYWEQNFLLFRKHKAESISCAFALPHIISQMQCMIAFNVLVNISVIYINILGQLTDKPPWFIINSTWKGRSSQNKERT